MAQTTTDQGGNQYILENGRWRPFNAQEQAISEQSGLSVFSESARNFGGGLSALAAWPLAGPMHRPVVERQIAESFGRQEQLQAIRPNMAAFGEGSLEVLAAPLALPARAGTRGSRPAARTIAREVTPAGARVNSRALQEALPETGEQIEQLGDTVQSVVPRDANAMQRQGFWASMRRMPGLRGMMEGIEAQLATQRRLSPTQLKFLEEGTVDKVGLQLLPGQRSGWGTLTEAMMRDPFLADAFDSITSANSARLGNLVSRSVNLPEGAWGQDIRELSRISIGKMFDDVESGIGQIDVPEQMVPRLQAVLTPTERKNLQMDMQGLAGSDVMDVREKIADELASMQMPGANRLASDVRAMDELLEEYDDLIEAAIDDPTLLPLWQEARTRWRVVRALDRQGVITADGDLSLKSLTGALEREFVREYRRRSLVKGDNLPPDVAEMMDFVRVARTFTSNLNDSGTATGNSVMNAISNPSSYVKKRVAAKFIADVFVNRPDLADTMPGP